jgi:hypothetical protein
MTLNDMFNSMFNEQISDVNILDDTWSECCRNIVDVSIRSSSHYHEYAKGKALERGREPCATYDSINHWLWGCAPILHSNGVQYMGNIKLKINEQTK